MNTIVQSFKTFCSGLRPQSWWKSGWVWFGLVVPWPMAHAMPPPRPNTITAFHIQSDDALLVSTSYHLVFRGSPDGSVWTATAPDASPLFGPFAAGLHAAIRVGPFDYACHGAGVKKWTPDSPVATVLSDFPEMKQCRSLAHAGANLYAATWNGLYACEDPGLHWRPVPGLPDIGISNVFAGPTYGVYVSGLANKEQDSVTYRYQVGRGWKRIDFGKPARPPRDPDAGWHTESDFRPTLISMVDDVLYASSLAGLIRSTDGGLQWTAFQAGLPDPLDARNIDPLDVVFVIRKNAAGVLHAATWRGIYRYVERAQQWEAVPLAGTRIGDAFFGPLGVPLQ
jgi:hypothetical protein